MSAPPGNAPADFNADEREAWRWILEQAPPGVFCVHDTLFIEIVARLLAIQRRDPGGFGKAQTRILRTMLGDLGATPAGRRKLEKLGAVPAAHPRKVRPFRRPTTASTSNGDSDHDRDDENH